MWHKPSSATIALLGAITIGAIISPLSSLPVGAEVKTAAATPPPVHEYRLGVQDTVRVRIYQFNPEIGDARELKSFGGEFAIGPAGTISLPLIGPLPATGRTVGELADTIGDVLQRKIGLKTHPQASVEIVKYRPFYILGGVAKPGEYDYRPGITVLQAVSLAGGVYRGIDSAGPEARQGAVTMLGNLRVLVLSEDRLTARAARLRAELADAPSITFPAELMRRQSVPAVAEILRQEQVEFSARAEGFRSQLQSLAQYRDFLLKETDSLHSKSGNQDQELALLTNELNHVSALVKNGLAVAPREFELRQSQSEMQARRLDLDVESLRVRQEISKSDQAVIDLRAKRREAILTDLDQTQSKLNEVVEQIKTTRQILADRGISAGDIDGDRQQDTLTYSIVRHADGKTHEITAAEDDLVEPGDTIRVTRGNAAQSVAGAAPAVVVAPIPPATPAPALATGGALRGAQTASLPLGDH
ncbi:MAG TPA: polysaccharide biosynthesis/export family protein [Stellaceae bacterium]|nr:polysaccharide biosynthesis/export family protein [Stellaceae bacterium]